LRLCPTAIMQTESVRVKNISEIVLDNVTLNMTLLFVETSAAICRTTQHNIREDLGFQIYLFYYYYYYYYYYYCTYICWYVKNSNFWAK